MRTTFNTFLIKTCIGVTSKSKISQVKLASSNFIKNMSDHDWLYLLTFSTSINWISTAQGRVSSVRTAAMSTVSNLIASGSTSLYDAVATGYDKIKTLQTNSTTPRSYSIVLLTDGEDTTSSKYTTLSSLLSALPDGTSSDQARIHAIAYGTDANQAILQQISSRTNGIMFPATTANIATVYNLIAMEF